MVKVKETSLFAGSIFCVILQYVACSHINGRLMSHGTSEHVSKNYYDGSGIEELRNLIESLSSRLSNVENHVATKNDILTAVPLGTIIPWVNKPNKNAPHTEDIPEGWTICDGSVIVSGVWMGITTPDLNSQGRFVRGGLLSEVLDMEESMLQDHLHLDTGHSHTDSGHTHVDAGHTHAYTYFSLGGSGGEIQWGGDAKRTTSAPQTQTSSANIQTASAAITSSNSGITGVDTNSANKGAETRPVNMRVIWIIKTENPQ